MSTGAYGDAISVLDHTLRDLKTYFLAQAAKMATEEEEQLLPNDSDEDDEDDETERVKVIMGPICMSDTYEYSTGEQQAEYSLCNRVLLVHGIDEETFWCSEVNVAIATAVVLYNKTLVYHILGKGDSKMLPIEKYLQRAKVLYEKALQLVKTCSVSATDDFLIKSALLNNLGQLCLHYCDRDGEQSYLAFLESMLAHHHLRAKTVPFRMTPPEVEIEFSLNVILLRGYHRPSPAA
jgi:hypothetical protein